MGAANTAQDTPEMLPEQAWRITGGTLDADELAALTAVLLRCCGRVSVPAEHPAQQRRVDAKWLPAEARRRVATSWAAGALPSWRVAA
ncbi:hypothetical protein ACFZB9_28275 [Kitasatospora sp. NPDC008050]|uniref:hypothetical protein n=1 Tax=Kitasatospora sp. NPDC008050 TaxID=3364021 RepID=UPI0036E576B1